MTAAERDPTAVLEGLPRWRRALYAVLPTVVVLAVVELVVRVALPDAGGVDLSRGFDGGARYLVPEPGGGHRTAMFVRPADEQVIPPKGDALRVVLFGGSNTEGFPYDWLDDRLSEVAAAFGRDVEVVNLGRRGYGSGRVRLLVPQALALEPDLLLVYSGHNEFVEASFRLDLELASGASAGGALHGIEGVARHLAVYRALQGRFAERAGATRAARRPQEQAFEHEKFAALPWEGTLEKYAEYRANLEAMVADARGAGVPLVLCTVAGNDFSAPFVSTPPASLDAAGRATLAAALEEARALQPESLDFLVPTQPEGRLHFEDWLRTDGTPLADDALPPVTPHGGVFGYTPRWWSPPVTWSPRVAPFLRGLYDVRNRLLTAEALEATRASRAPLERALALAPDHPEALWRLGLVELVAGDRGRGAVLLRLGAARDRAPRKGTQFSNDIVRDVAARLGVPLADVEARMRARVPDGLVGFELMRDECHFHQAPRYVLVLDLADALLPVLFPDLTAHQHQQARQAWDASLRGLIADALATGEKELTRGGGPAAGGD